MNPDRSTIRPAPDATETSHLRIPAAVAGVCAVGLAIYHVATPGLPGGAVYVSFADYFREVGFLLFLVATIAAVVGMPAAGITNRLGTRLVAGGYSLIAAGVAIGLVVRQELDWFFVLAGPGLLLSTVGFIVLAVGIWRRSSLPRWAAVLAGVGGALAIIMTEFGTGVLIGAFWLFVAASASEGPRRAWARQA